MITQDCRDCIYFFEDTDRKKCLAGERNHYGGAGCPKYSTNPFEGREEKHEAGVN